MDGEQVKDPVPEEEPPFQLHGQVLEPNIGTRERERLQETYRKDKKEIVLAVLSDRQIQCLREQIANQTARVIGGESERQISPIGLYLVPICSDRGIYRRSSDLDSTISGRQIRNAQAGLAEGGTGRSFTSDGFSSVRIGT